MNQRPKDGTWEGIDIKALPQLRAKRWTLRLPPKDITFDEATARRWYAPVVVQDTITTVNGRYEVKINREKKLEVSVISTLYWIQPRKMVAIRVSWASRDIKVGRAHYSQREIYTPTVLTDYEHTWFFERYRSNGRYCFDERAHAGMRTLEHLRMLKALRFD
jgi:hypothetical protein